MLPRMRFWVGGEKKGKEAKEGREEYWIITRKSYEKNPGQKKKLMLRGTNRTEKSLRGVFAGWR